MNSTDINALRALLSDEKRVLLGDEISEDYSHDELASNRRAPDAVVLVTSTEEVSAVLRFAWERDIPVTPRGAGTGLVGGCVPMAGGILLDTTRMNRILELDEENLTLTVEPGVLLADVYAHVEPLGYFYPPDPGEKYATIGGNIATNAGGMRAVKYGVTRDYIRGLEVVLPGGNVITLGGKVVKNSSGYALKDLMVGSEGTLGVITKAILKLLPLPEKQVTLLIPFPTLEQAIGTVPVLLASRAMPTAVEFMQREVIRDAEAFQGRAFPDSTGDAYLLLKFDGNMQEELDSACELAADLCLERGALDILLADTNARAETLWTTRGVFLEAIKCSTTAMDEVDTVVPRSHVAELIAGLDAVAGQVGVRIKCFGHAGDGNLHIYVLKDALTDAEWEQRLYAAMDLIYEKARALDGQVSGEHGIGHAKRPYLKADLSGEVLALMRGVKQVFDPKNLLNPGKILMD